MKRTVTLFGQFYTSPFVALGSQHWAFTSLGRSGAGFGVSSAHHFGLSRRRMSHFLAFFWAFLKHYTVGGVLKRDFSAYRTSERHCTHPVISIDRSNRKTHEKGPFPLPPSGLTIFPKKGLILFLWIRCVFASASLWNQKVFDEVEYLLFGGQVLKPP